MKDILFRVLFSAILVSIITLRASALMIEGISFKNSISIKSQNYFLVGAKIRKSRFLQSKKFSLALYLSQRPLSTEDLKTQEGLKVLELYFLEKTAKLSVADIFLEAAHSAGPLASISEALKEHIPDAKTYDQFYFIIGPEFSDLIVNGRKIKRFGGPDLHTLWLKQTELLNQDLNSLAFSH